MSDVFLPARDALPPVWCLGLGLPVRPCLPAEREETAPCIEESLLRHPLLRQADVLIGGVRHLRGLAAHPAEKLLLGADAQAVYQRVRENRAAGKTQVALCSGDPLFFGLGARLAEALGPEAVRVVPGLGSLQAAACLANIPLESIRSVSLHGRKDMMSLAHALLAGGPVLVLTDAETSPASLAAWLRERGRCGYVLHVLEDMYLTPQGDVRTATHARFSLDQAPEQAPDRQSCLRPDVPRVLLLVPDPAAAAPPWPFGIADADIEAENGLLTKAPVRAAALAALGVEPGHTVWDLGAGSGAVAVEAARLAWQGRVCAVERDPARLALIRANRARFGAANLEIVAGSMPGCLAQPGEGQGALLPRPQRVFIGGGLGGGLESGPGPLIGDSERAAEQTLRLAWEALLPGGRLLVSCVLLGTLERARAALGRLGARSAVSSLQAGIGAPLAGDIRLQALNPVFFITADKANEG